MTAFLIIVFKVLTFADDDRFFPRVVDDERKFFLLYFTSLSLLNVCRYVAAHATRTCREALIITRREHLW